MPTLRTQGLRREFGDVTALDGVDVDIDGAEIIGVAGPNGAGKTTLIETLLGLLAPTEGVVRVDGTDPLTFDADDRRLLGYMPQHEAIYRDLTTRQNVDFFARLYGVHDRKRAVDRALELVDLADRADSRVADLSGGMIRRASLACAVVQDPGVIFLDEPTVGLDPQLRATMWDGFRQRRDDGALVVVSTHYLGEARHCDRVLFLRDGKELAFDTPAAFLERTGTADLDDAFLALLSEGDDGAVTAVDGGVST
ncbi:MAG: ABC transporter ATP-binding protein [Haloarculaceae archaeon]